MTLVIYQQPLAFLITRPYVKLVQFRLGEEKGTSEVRTHIAKMVKSCSGGCRARSWECNRRRMGQPPLGFAAMGVGYTDMAPSNTIKWKFDLYGDGYINFDVLASTDGPVEIQLLKNDVDDGEPINGGLAAGVAVSFSFSGLEIGVPYKIRATQYPSQLPGDFVRTTSEPITTAAGAESPRSSLRATHRVLLHENGAARAAVADSTISIIRGTPARLLVSSRYAVPVETNGAPAPPRPPLPRPPPSPTARAPPGRRACLSRLPRAAGVGLLERLVPGRPGRAARGQRAESLLSPNTRSLAARSARPAHLLNATARPATCYSYSHSPLLDAPRPRLGAGPRRMRHTGVWRLHTLGRGTIFLRGFGQRYYKKRC